MISNILQGIKIADFGWAAAGPLVSRCLGAYGATVVRVESAEYPDVTRTSYYKSKIPGVNRSGNFAYLNTDKYSLSVNLRHHLGKSVAEHLVAWADVVIENFTPGVMDKLGLGYDDLIKIKPGIIMLSASNQGQTGPHAHTPGFGFTLTPMVGLSNLTGWADGEPCLIYGAMTDMYGAWLSTTVLMSALDYRRRTGKGQYLDLAEYETGVLFVAPLLLHYQVNSEEFFRNGNRSPNAAPHGAYKCKGEDQWCVIAVETDEEWQWFCRAMGNPAWSQSSRLATLQGRKENEDKLDALIEKWTRDKTREEVMNLLQSAGVPAGIVASQADLLRNPQLQYRRFWQVLQHPEIGPQTYERPAHVLSETPVEIGMPGPCLGQHNEFVCKELLGMNEEEFSEFLLQASSL